MQVAPYGTWASPLTASAIAAGGLRLNSVALDGDDVYWVEGRPSEGGRSALMRRRADAAIEEVTPREVNVRTRVHEYGGGAYTVADGAAWYVNFADQRVYRVGDSAPLTPPGYLYADFAVDRRRQRLIAVREDHTAAGREPINALVALPLGRHDAPTAGDVLASGYDFYSTPRLSPDGSQLCWLSWRHPQMPWDGTELWVADITAAGTLERARHIAGSATESIYQPGWSPDGHVHFVSDRSGWWCLYREDEAGAVVAVIRNPAPRVEFGRPQWLLATASWAFAGPTRLVVSYSRDGRWRLATIDTATGTLADFRARGEAGASAARSELQPQEFLVATGTHAFLVAGSSTAPDALVRLDLQSGAVEAIRVASSIVLDEGNIAIPEPIEFPTANSQNAHAFYYAPRNKDFAAPPDERPPLIVISHGGPTTAARATFDLQIQFWTTRGFAVVDVNYGGSSGYGREYRERLNGQWGVVDVADVVHAAQHLARQGKADSRRLAIRGGSAGGYTTLAALTFYPGVFGAGASYYGVSDIEVLVRDTHKFEARYLDTLIGPYPEHQDLYRQRSPIHAIDRLASPLILLQGLEDKIVPPNQSEMMADAVRAKGLPVAYLAFEGEQHGFRKATTIVRSLEAELYFYGAVFGFRVADPIEPVEIANL
jgi:dipeptidyl aminopeptidase/acylaminoacyl peptidase